MRETKKMAPSRTGIPPDARAEISRRLSAETKITSCEIAEILKKHDVCGDIIPRDRPFVDPCAGEARQTETARGLRRAAKELTRQRKKKPREQQGGAPAADGTEQKTTAIKTKDTAQAAAEPQTAAERGRRQMRQNAAQKAAKVKSKDAYIGAQTETQVTVVAEPQRQGQRVFVEERGRKAARWQAEQKRAVSRRQIKTAQALRSDKVGGTMPDRPCSDQFPRIKERTMSSLPKLARKHSLPVEREVSPALSRSRKTGDAVKAAESVRKRAAMPQSGARAAREVAARTMRYQQAAKAAQATAQKASQAAGRAPRQVPRPILAAFQDQGWTYTIDYDYLAELGARLGISRVGCTDYNSKRIYVSKAAATLHEVGHFLDSALGFPSEHERLYLTEARNSGPACAARKQATSSFTCELENSMLN